MWRRDLFGDFVVFVETEKVLVVKVPEKHGQRDEEAHERKGLFARRHFRRVLVLRLEVLRGALQQNVRGRGEHHHVAAFLDARRRLHPGHGAFRELALLRVLALPVLAEKGVKEIIPSNKRKAEKRKGDER